MIQKILFISLGLLGLVQFSFGQKTVAPSKQKLVSNLVTTTQQLFPFQQFETTFQKNVEMTSVEFEKLFTEAISEKIDSLENVSTGKKQEIKAKIPAFAGELTKLTNRAISQNFHIKAWLDESSAKHYANSFSVTELQKLNQFFQSADGKKSLLAMNKAIAEGFENKKADTNSAEAEAFAKSAEKLLRTPLGEKFFRIISFNIMNDISAKMDDWGDNFAKSFKENLSEEDFKLMLDKFIEEHLKS